MDHEEVEDNHEMMDQEERSPIPELRVHWDWDWENTSVTNVSFAVSMLRRHITLFLPGLYHTSITAYGNAARLTSRQASDFFASAVDFKDVPGNEPNEAGHSMMTDMLLRATDGHPPCYIMAITGDSNFCEALTSLRESGNRVILAYPENGTAEELFDAVDHSIPWERLSRKGLRSIPFANDIHVAVPAVVGLVNAVFWNTHACPAPSPNDVHGCLAPSRKLMYQKAADCIDQMLESDNTTALGTTVTYLAYSDFNIGPYLPNQVSYIRTQSNNKQHSMKNKMLVDIFRFTRDNAAPANIVVLTDNEDIARVLQALKQRGYNIYVAVPSTGNGLKRLEAVARPRLFYWYAWLRHLYGGR